MNEAFHHSSTIVTDIAKVMAFACYCAWEMRQSAFATNSCTLLCASTEDEVNTCIRTWRKRLKKWYKDTVFKPPSHGLRWKGLWVLQMTLLPNCCLTDGPFDVKKKSASFVGGRISGINYGLCDSWLTRPCWQCLTFAHCILQMKSSASQAVSYTHLTLPTKAIV